MCIVTGPAERDGRAECLAYCASICRSGGISLFGLSVVSSPGLRRGDCVPAQQRSTFAQGDRKAAQADGREHGAVLAQGGQWTGGDLSRAELPEQLIRGVGVGGQAELQLRLADGLARLHAHFPVRLAGIVTLPREQLL